MVVFFCQLVIHKIGRNRITKLWPFTFLRTGVLPVASLLLFSQGISGDTRFKEVEFSAWSQLNHPSIYLPRIELRHASILYCRFILEICAKITEWRSCSWSTQFLVSKVLTEVEVITSSRKYELKIFDFAGHTQGLVVVDMEGQFRFDPVFIFIYSPTFRWYLCPRIGVNQRCYSICR